MPAEQKDRVLEELRAGRVQVLVSTQVIEVGIDLPKATVMVIENAERFGLSSLHQLRGRVGRSALPSWCLFFSGAVQDEAVQRLKAFAANSDGFRIAELDFELRGPGQFFGTEQSGMPEFIVAHLLKDRDILLAARQDAQGRIETDPALNHPENSRLRQRLRLTLGDRLGLIEVG
jgi:ATP-dependent DNA helicase RecG